MSELLNLYPYRGVVVVVFFSLFWGLILYSLIVPVKHEGIDSYMLPSNKEP